MLAPLHVRLPFSYRRSPEATTHALAFKNTFWRACAHLESSDRKPDKHCDRATPAGFRKSEEVNKHVRRIKTHTHTPGTSV